MFYHTIITISIIYTILIMCGVNMYLKNKQHKETIDNDWRKFVEAEKNKLEIFRQRIEFEMTKLQYEMDREISSNSNIDFKKSIEDIDLMIKSIVEPELRMKCIRNNKALDRTSFEDIIIPIASEEHNKNISFLKAEIINKMPKDAKRILSKYLSESSYQRMISNMITIYYYQVIQNLMEYKNKLAEEDNYRQAASKISLFINGKVNSQAGLTNEQVALINTLNIRTVEELEKTITLLVNDKDNMWEAYKPLTSINIDIYK